MVVAAARLVVTSRNAATDQEEVEVAHEALIRYWAELRGWLDEDRTSLRLRETISQAAQAWEAGAGAAELRRRSDAGWPRGVRRRLPVRGSRQPARAASPGERKPGN